MISLHLNLALKNLISKNGNVLCCIYPMSLTGLGHAGSTNQVVAKRASVGDDGAALARYLKKLDKYGEKEEDECNSLRSISTVLLAFAYRADSQTILASCRKLPPVASFGSCFDFSSSAYSFGT
jgi:hypothetical protein